VIKFGANILSQTVQRNLGRATLDLSTTSERLASGQRINKASDDAAGLAIAASLNVNARIFTQGVRNLNDGLSAVNIAEGAMGELGGIIVRIEELASQSISETYSDTQRQALQKEATALTAEWNRIVESTTFNGQNLLTGANTRTVLQGGKGSEGTLAVQVGADYDGRTSRVSVGASGAEANATSLGVSISADGQQVAFYSDASNLVSGDTNGVGDYFLRNLATGTTTRISTSSSGGQSNAVAQYTFLSANGRFATFQSTATNLVASATSGEQQVYIKDTVSGELRLASVTASGILGNAGSTNGSLSSDGTWSVIDSFASNFVAGDTNGTRDVFLKNTVTGDLRLVSVSQAGLIGNGQSFAMDVSDDGRYVTFNSDASNLVVGDTNGVRDAFVKDMVTGSVSRVSTSSAGEQANGGSYTLQRTLTADGRYVAFWSLASNLVAGDTNGGHDSFVKDLQTGEVSRVSTTATGGQANGNSRVSSISADGRYVVFESDASNLVAGDTNGQFDSFIKDRVDGSIRRISVDSSGQEGNSLSYEGVVTPDGRYAAFISFASNLVDGDTNGAGDIFVRDLTKTGVQTLSGVVVSDKASAKVTLDLAQRYRAELLDYRSKLGATTSRISTFVNTLQSSTINYKAASSRIIDADIAEEAAKSIASGIRQQVASSLLGQANQAPQIGLQLLRNA
jgi:flagellin-like hook-associated protein FlgL